MENKIQVYPAKKLFIALDKMKKRVFDTTDDDTELGILEDKRAALITNLHIDFSEEFKEQNSLTKFDELVFDVCLSAQFQGNEFTTPSIIHRAMGGSKSKTTSLDKERILQSVRKLSKTFVDFDISELCKKFGYNEGRGYQYSGPLLPCEYITATVNGWTDSAVIHFLKNSPLLDVAKIKKQIRACDISLLDVPSTRNSELVLSLKGELLRRIIQIIGSHETHKKHFQGGRFRTVRKLQKKILLETLFEQCGLSDADNAKKRDARNTIAKILNHFQNHGLISEWQFEKKDGKFYAVIFDFSIEKT